MRSALGRIAHDRDLLWLYLTSALGGGGRGLGVVNLFALLYMTRVLGLDEGTSGLMYGALIVFSVPIPIVAGWLSDRIGRKPLIIGVYLGGAVGFVVFLLGRVEPALAVGRDLPDGPVHLRREPAAPGAPRRHRAAVDARRVVRALLRDGVRGRVAVDDPLRPRHRALGEAQGVPVVFVLMAMTFVLAALGTVPIRAEQRARENAAFEATLG